MKVGLAIYYILSSDTAVTDIVSTRIFPETAPQGQLTPYIVYSVISNAPSDTKESGENIDVAQIEIYTVETTYAKAVNLGGVIRDALDRKVGTFNSVQLQTTSYKSESMEVNETRSLWASVQDYEIRVKR